LVSALFHPWTVLCHFDGNLLQETIALSITFLVTFLPPHLCQPTPAN